MNSRESTRRAGLPARLAILLALALTASMAVHPARTQPAGGDAPEVFSEAARPASAEPSEREDDPLTERLRYVSIDFSLFPGPREDAEVHERLSMQLFDDVHHVAALTRSTEVESGVVAWSGKVEGVASSDVNLIAHSGSVLAGTVRMPGALYEIAWDSDGVHVVVEVDASAFMPELEPPVPEKPLSFFGEEDPAEPTAGNAAQIDVLAVYTPAARDGAGGTTQIEAAIHEAVLETNSAYENSLVDQRIRLVHQQEVDYTEHEDGVSTDLEQVREDGDGVLDDVHTIRDDHGADVVALIVDDPGRSNACGVGYLMAPVASEFEAFAFSVTERTCIPNLTFAHELGHNMGLAHDRYSYGGSTDPISYPYAYGFVDPTTPRDWRTIMAHNSRCKDDEPETFCTRLLFFSNPDLTHDGDPMGVPEGEPDEADARKALNNTADTVAGFRANLAQPPVVADFLGDGATDISIFRPSNGNWYVKGTSPVRWGVQDGDIPVPGNYNGDWKTDIAVYRPSNGFWYIRDIHNVRWGIQAGDVPVPGDYDGDGSTDIAVYRPSNGRWYIRGGTHTTWGIQAGDVPVPGDYDGDGATDVAVYRPSNGYWYIKGVANIRWGIQEGDVPVPGDFNGDGSTDIAIYRPSNGTWYIRDVQNTRWGIQAGDMPVPGDYDGDGATDIAIYRPSNGRWYVKDVTHTTWGIQDGDIPLPLPAAIRTAYFS